MPLSRAEDTPASDSSNSLNPLPAEAPSEITDLEFKDFFKMPVGPYGLEMTDKLKGLDGKKVRLTGYMVKEDRCKAGHAHNAADSHKEVVNGRFMLSPAPVMVSYACFATSDDLFPQTVFVRIPALADKPVPYVSNSFEVVGTLSVGPSEEPDERISQVRLTLDALPKNSQVIEETGDHENCHNH